MKYFAVFLQKENEEYSRLGEKQFNPQDKIVSFKDKTFYIDLKRIGYTGKNFKLFFLDYDAEKKETKNNLTAYTGYLTFNEVKTHISPEELDMFVRKQIFKQFALAAYNTAKNNWVLVIAVLIAGLFCGYVICTVVNPSHSYIQRTLPNGTTIIEELKFMLFNVKLWLM